MRADGPLARPMADAGDPAWSGARWIGLLDGIPAPGPLELADAAGYARARFLVRDSGSVRGFVEADVRDGRVDGAALADWAVHLPEPAVRPADAPLPGVSVVISSRDRPDQLATALRSVFALDHPDFEIVVVDNASRTGETQAVVADLAPSAGVPVRCVVEPRPGLAIARNTGVRAATGEIVAFTDDDVVVDPGWLRRLADGFARGTDVDCVSGLVPSGELRTPVQAYFEQRVSWASSCRTRVFRLAEPPADIPLFPFRVGLLGTGANFAMRRSAVFELGGFDEALGVGSPTLGAEDIDMFVRVIASGRALTFEPSAVVWHRHRSDVGALEHQAIGYGVGLGAWLTKIALDRSLNGLAVRRAVAGYRRARVLFAPADASSDPAIDPELRAELARVGRAERKGVLTGPLRYAEARRSGRVRRPLSPPPPGSSR